ncbi:MAG: hypothetical protein ABFR90_10340, partial [Planctomycetota bacterium]
FRKTNPIPNLVKTAQPLIYQCLLPISSCLGSPKQTQYNVAQTPLLESKNSYLPPADSNDYSEARCFGHSAGGTPALPVPPDKKNLVNPVNPVKIEKCL